MERKNILSEVIREMERTASESRFNSEPREIVIHDIKTWVHRIKEAIA